MELRVPHQLKEPKPHPFPCLFLKSSIIRSGAPSNDVKILTGSSDDVTERASISASVNKRLPDIPLNIRRLIL